MTIPVEQFTAPASTSVADLGDSVFEGFAIEASAESDESDGLYAEITERRAQLENADILRGARAL